MEVKKSVILWCWKGKNSFPFWCGLGQVGALWYFRMACTAHVTLRIRIVFRGLMCRHGLRVSVPDWIPLRTEAADQNCVAYCECFLSQLSNAINQKSKVTWKSMRFLCQQRFWFHYHIWSHYHLATAGEGSDGRDDDTATKGNRVTETSCGSHTHHSHTHTNTHTHTPEMMGPKSTPARFMT